MLNVTTNAKPVIFIAKYNKSGNLLWINSANGISYDYCNGISADTSGNAYITGSFSSENMNFGPYSLTNSTIGHNFYIAKYGNFVNTNESYYINLYPNPATDILNIETNFITKQKFEILNILGQTIFSSEIVNKTAVNLGYLATGVYMVKVNLGKSILSRKFIKE